MKAWTQITKTDVKREPWKELPLTTTGAVQQHFCEHMSSSDTQLLLLHVLPTSSLSTPCGGSISQELEAEGCGLGRRWKNAISSLSLDPLRSVGLYISSSTVSRCLQLLIATALHHRPSTAQLQHLFRWLAKKKNLNKNLCRCDRRYTSLSVQRSEL